MNINGKEIDCKDLLRKFYLGNDKAAIEQYYHTASFLELFGIERWETSHTRFLTWLFNNSESVVRKFLYLIQKWSELQKRYLDSELSKCLYLDKFVFESIKAKSEALSESEGYGKGNTDIVMDCSIIMNGFHKTMHIIIENKIYSLETIKKTNYCIEYQTDSYYNNYVNKYKNDINVFVFLKPVTTYELSQATKETLEKWCHCDKYIIINYQELVDFVLTPFVNSDNIDSRVKYIVKEYIKSLGKTTENSKYSNKQIMAMGSDEKQLLESFYLKNRDLIYAALTAVIDSGNPAISEDEKSNASKWAIQENNIRVGKRIKFTGNIGNEKFVHLNATKVVARFAEFLLKKNYNVVYINTIINKYSHKTGKSFSDSDAGFNYYYKDGQPVKHRCYKFEVNNIPYYVTDQWSPNEPNGDWQSFMSQVNGNPDYNCMIKEE